MLLDIAWTVRIKRHTVTVERVGAAELNKVFYIKSWRETFLSGAEVRWEAYCKGLLELSGGSYLRNRRVRKVISLTDF